MHLPYVLALGVLLLALGLTAGFWLPVLAEQDAVQLANLTAVPQLTYRNFFVPWAELLGGLPRFDGAAQNGIQNVHIIGLPLWIGALTGVVALLWRWRRKQVASADVAQAAFFALLALLFLFLISPTSAPLWDAFRPLAYLQFPGRLLGAAACCLALLLAEHGRWLAALPARLQMGALALIVPLLILPYSPLLYAPEWTHTTLDTSMAAYHQAEIRKDQSGTTYTDEYRPTTVYTPPGPTLRLIDDYADGYPINKANPPAGVEVTLIRNAPEYNEWVLRAEADFTLEVLTYYWVGWQAWVDGVAVPITPSPEHGLITLPVPAGEHRVVVALGWTTPRLIGAALSAASAVLLLALVQVRGLGAAWGAWPSPAPLGRTAWMGLGAGVAVLALGAGVFWRPGLAWLASPTGTSPAQTPTDYRLGDEFAMLGYDLNATSFRAGETVEVTLYYRALQAIDEDYSGFVHIGQLGAPPLAQADKLHTGEREARRYSTEGYWLDRYRITLPASLPPGTYVILAGLYTCDRAPEGACGNGYRPPVTDGAGTAYGDVMVLAEIQVE